MGDRDDDRDWGDDRDYYGKGNTTNGNTNKLPINPKVLGHIGYILNPPEPTRAGGAAAGAAADYKRRSRSAGVSESKVSEENNSRVIQPVPIPTGQLEPSSRSSSFNILNFEPEYNGGNKRGDGQLVISKPGGDRNIIGTPSAPREISILFLRHSESCANMMKRVGQAGRNKYLDPELTRRGEQMALERGGELLSLIPSDLGGEGPLIYGCSVLRRTQQTVHGLRRGLQQGIEKIMQNISTNPTATPEQKEAAIDTLQKWIESTTPTYDPILVLPYISEISNVVATSTGYDRDNTPLPASQRAAFTAPAVHFPLADSIPDAATPNIDKFFSWLGQQAMSLDFLGLGGEGSNRYRMVIVTHGHWLRELVKKMGVTQKYNNIEGAAVKVTYSRDATGRIIERKELLSDHLPYTPSPAVHSAICPDNCRNANICSGKPGTVCERLEGLYNNPNPPSQDILDLAKDLKIAEAYHLPEPRPAVKRAIDQLGAYKSGFFTRKRNTQRLKGDLNQLLEEYGCAKQPLSDEACRSITDYLGRGQNTHLTVPNSFITNLSVKANVPSLKKYTRKSWWNRPLRIRREGLTADIKKLRRRCRPEQLPITVQAGQSPVLESVPVSAQNAYIAAQVAALNPTSGGGAAAPYQGSGGGRSRRRKSRRGKKRQTRRYR